MHAVFRHNTEAINLHEFNTSLCGLLQAAFNTSFYGCIQAAFDTSFYGLMQAAFDTIHNPSIFMSSTQAFMDPYKLPFDTSPCGLIQAVFRYNTESVNFQNLICWMLRLGTYKTQIVKSQRQIRDRTQVLGNSSRANLNIRDRKR